VGIQDDKLFELPTSVRASGFFPIRYFPDISPRPTRGCQPRFVMQHQEQTNWCWAAVSVSVAEFFASPSDWTQCSLANQELNRIDCCGQSGAAAGCNAPWYLDRPLMRVGHYRTMTAGSVVGNVVETELTAALIVCCRIVWRGGGAHFVAIWCCTSASPMSGPTVSVGDPWYGQWDGSYAAFVSNYRSAGSWSHTYFTKR
jgi:hypothetical protein